MQTYNDMQKQIIKHFQNFSNFLQCLITGQTNIDVLTLTETLYIKIILHCMKPLSLLQVYKD